MKYLETEAGRNALSRIGRKIREKKLTSVGDVMEETEFSDLLNTVIDDLVAIGENPGFSEQLKLIDIIIQRAILEVEK